MSDIGIAGPKKTTTAKMPGAVEINQPKLQPGNNIAPAPNMPATNIPNVNGGKAAFSSVTSTLQDFVSSKVSELSATNDALKANTSIDTSANEQISGLTTLTMGALQNIQKAQQLPGGAQGKVAKLFSLFDSDYNVESQKTTAAINQQKAEQIAATAKAMKEQNNVLPTVLGKVSEATKLVFDAQKDANQLAINEQTLNNQVAQTRIAAAHLRIDMSQEVRAATDFKIRGMSTSQIEAELPKAEAGKGAFAGKAGLLKERLVAQTAAETSMKTAQLALSKGNREEFNDSAVDAVSHMPVDAVSQRMAAAQASGNPMVTFPTGEKGQTIDIPYNLVQQALVKNLALQNQTNTAVATDMVSKSNLSSDVTNISRSAMAMASMDPRASQIYVNFANLIKDADMKNPQVVRQVILAKDEAKKQMEQVGKDAASKMSTPVAKGAMETFAKTGTFDNAGGAAVTADSINIPSLRTNSRFGDAWTQLSVSIANQLAQQHFPGAGAAPSDATDAQSMLAMLMAKPSGKEKVTALATEMLTDPNKMKPIRDSIKGTMKAGAMFNVVTQLAHGKDANPFWGNVLANIDQFKEGGNLSPAKMFDAMEQARVVSHGKMDFSGQFLSGLQNYGMSAQNGSAVDPSYTVQDHALEAAIFGSNPAASVIGELHYSMRQLAEKARQEMSDRIKKDMTGQTQKDAAGQSVVGSKDYDAIFGPAGIFTDWAVEKYKKKTGVDMNQVPSATGTGLTVAQIQAIFGGGK